MTGSTGTLYTPAKYYRSQRIEIAAKYSGFQLKKVDYVPGKTDKDTAFLAKFPADAVPTFESNDHTYLFDASAIAAYVGNEQLKGGKQEPEVIQWANWADSVISPAVATWVYPCLGVTQFNKSATEHAKSTIQTALTHLNNYLSKVTYLVGERLTQADITLFCNLVLLFEHVLDAQARAPFPHVVRWFTTMMHQPNVEAVVGKVQLCAQAKQFDAKKYAELHPKPDGGKKGKEKKDEKKKETPKKEEKKPAPKKEDDDEDDEPKKKDDKDPFSALPKGTFDMDEFKRTFSNNDIASVAIPYFWEKFDAENYSIWHCEYQYANELKLIFMSSNLITGMFQRLDRMRKHAFGSMAVFGENNNNTICGVWVWRGVDLAFKLHADLQIDYDVFTWKKLDPASEETKTLVKQYFLHEGEFNGKKLAQGKIFK